MLFPKVATVGLARRRRCFDNQVRHLPIYSDPVDANEVVADSGNSFTLISYTKTLVRDNEYQCLEASLLQLAPRSKQSNLHGRQHCQVRQTGTPKKCQLSSSFYAGQPPLNRLSFQRGHVDKINEHLSAKDARFVLYKDSRPLVKKGEPGQLLFLKRTDVESLIGDGFKVP